MNTNRCTRRRFLKQAATVAAGLALPQSVASRVLRADGGPGANEQLNVAVIGTGVRGKYLIGNCPPEIRVVAICDCHAPRMADTLQPKARFASVLASFAERDARSCETFQDYRRLLDKAKLDAVMIATPDHHHVLPAILACQAGLDVYLEKPLSLTIPEGRLLVQAVRRYGRVLQVGSQQRSMEINRFGCNFIRNGGLGKLSHVRLPNYPGPMAYERLPEEPVPEGLNWDLFCGPTPTRSYNRRLWVKDEFRVDGVLWRGWDLWFDYSGHLATNWGAHSVDLVQLALGKVDTGPVEVWPIKDGYEGEKRFCPVGMRYANGVELRFDISLEDRNRWEFYGQRGMLSMHRNSLFTDPPDLVENRPDARLADKWKGAGSVARPHIENWIGCIRTRSEPAAPVEAGHRAVTICHLVGIARRSGYRLRWDPQRETFEDNEDANGLLDRPRRIGWELPEI